MKEKIYTIPVNEAYDTDCECPLCFLEKRLENEAVDYALGAAMMEPDFRTESNAVGYCSKHFAQMISRQNKLALALVLDTHLEEIRKKLKKHEKSMKAKSKPSIFNKKNSSDSGALLSELQKIDEGCMVCNKINATMERYTDVLLYMWANDEGFKEKFDRSKGVCLKHMSKLIQAVPKSLKGADCGDFLCALYEKQMTNLERIQADIHKFTLKFDYRNKNMEWGTAKDAPQRTIQKIAGNCIEEENIGEI